MCFLHPQVQAVIVFWGSAQDLGLDKVWCKRLLKIGFLVDHGFHSQWNKRFSAVVMGTVEVGIR